LLTVAADE
jgi:hypothetical protein